MYFLKNNNLNITLLLFIRYENTKSLHTTK